MVRYFVEPPSVGICLVSVFFLRLGESFLGRKTTEVKYHSNHTITRSMLPTGLLTVDTDPNHQLITVCQALPAFYSPLEGNHFAALTQVVGVVSPP